MRCCLMIFLLKCLMILLQNPQPLSPSKYVQTLNSNSATLIFPNRSHRVHLNLATTKTLTIRIHRYGSRSHRDGLASSLLLVAIMSVPPRIASVSPRWLDRFSVAFFLHFGPTEMRFALSPCTLVPPSCSHQSHQDS